MEEHKKEIKVSAKSPVQALASSIVFSIEEGHDVTLRAVGASAVNQMYKSITVARGTLASKGKDMYIKPGFDEVTEDGDKKTVMTATLIVK